VILDQTNKECQALEAQRTEYVRQSEALCVERDRAIGEAKFVKRKFEASKTKIEVLSVEGGKEEVIAKEREKIVGYKEEFKKLKEVRDVVAGKIHKLDLKIEHVEEALGHDRKRLREEASEAYQSIGKANQDISKLSAEVGMIEEEMKAHFIAIGRYVSQHVGMDPICDEVCKPHIHLIAQMQNLRSSIALNHKLVALCE
jgi:chromosome segregation ATPase